MACMGMGCSSGSTERSNEPMLSPDKKSFTAREAKTKHSVTVKMEICSLDLRKGI